MKKMLLALSTAILIAASFVPASAAARHYKAKPKAKPAVHRKVMSAICPVSGEKISPVTKSTPRSVYKGKTYYFCMASCKAKFDKNPEKYIKEAKERARNKKNAKHTKHMKNMKHMKM